MLGARHPDNSPKNRTSNAAIVRNAVSGCVRVNRIPASCRNGGRFRKASDETSSAVYDGSSILTKGNFQQIASRFCRMGDEEVPSTVRPMAWI
jgi:hypothetical protein